MGPAEVALIIVIAILAALFLAALWLSGGGQE
jgi:hypothetical protein